jgi:hypothetical protein
MQQKSHHQEVDETITFNDLEIVITKKIFLYAQKNAVMGNIAVDVKEVKKNKVKLYPLGDSDTVSDDFIKFK